MSSALERVEQIIDASGTAARIEARLPVGVRPRQLTARTLLIGTVLTILHGGKALLTNLHTTLTELPEPDRWRLGVIAPRKQGEHTLTYRQLEYTHRLIVKQLAKPAPDGSPSETLSEILDALLEASVRVLGEPDSTSYAVDWTDHETWARSPHKRQAASPSPAPNQSQPNPTADQQHEQQQVEKERADREAAWGHRRGDHPGQKDEPFFGYYLQAVTAVKDEHGPEVPELVRRMLLTSCDHDPPPTLVPVLKRMAASGIDIGDLLADSGYSYRVAESWALPVRQLGAHLIQDLHPNDRGPHGTHHGATIHNGNLYCPATPKPLLELGPLHRGATPEQTQAHDRQCQQLQRYKLSPITTYDPDGYRRVICPAAQGKLRCPLRPASLTLPHDRPTILTPPERPPTCCQQQTVTVPPTVNAKTAQKHDYPSKAHRDSYNRRTAAERAFSTVKDPATTDLARGWCRLTGLTPIALFIAAAFIARNIRIADSFAARQAENARRAAQGLPPKRRKRRRKTATDLITAANAPP